MNYDFDFSVDPMSFLRGGKDLLEMLMNILIELLNQTKFALNSLVELKYNVD